MWALEVELLGGVYRAALPDGSGAEWPPHPERLFSALVQSWADGGQRSDERRALEWLERQPPPLIEADHVVRQRDAPVVFVPPNDPRGDDPTVLPEARKRQARRFHGVAPEEPSIAYCWEDHLEPKLRSAFDALLRRLASLGHSASLVHARIRDAYVPRRERTWLPDPSGPIAIRVPHAGRLAALDDWFAAARRPVVGHSVRYRPVTAPPPEPVPRSAFGAAEDWFVFEDAGETESRGAPDVLSFPQVARRMRHALMSLASQPAPEVLSGHAADGSPSQRPHVAIVPLLDVGWPFSKGEVLGLAVVLPRDVPIDERIPVLKALGAFAHIESGEQQLAELHLTRSWTWKLRRAASPERASLQPTRYTSRARVWASATPVLLDRFPDGDDPIEIARIIAGSCRNIGLPEPVEIEIHKQPSHRGAPECYPARGIAHRPDWSFPGQSKLAQKVRRHVVLTFDQVVQGPVIIGAGRFQGLGLCLPLGRSEY
jgi:CRISPR-associated protein Csb2